MSEGAPAGAPKGGSESRIAPEKSGIHRSLRELTKRHPTNGMRVFLRIADGDWGGASNDNIEAVAHCVVDALTGEVEGEASIVLQVTDGTPIALSQLSSRGEFVVRVCVRGNRWAQLGFQFAHEFCHVLADATSWRRDRFAWLEESICETASLFALRSMAHAWASRPPYPQWRAYAVDLFSYAEQRMQEEAHALPAGVGLSEWLVGQLPVLEADPERRGDNTIIAKALLPIFETDPTAWRAVRHLHAWPRDDAASLSEFLSSWRSACPADARSAVERIADTLGVAFSN